MRYRFRNLLIVVNELTDKLSFSVFHCSKCVFRWDDVKERLNDLNFADLRYKYFCNALKGFVIKDSYLMY